MICHWVIKIFLFKIVIYRSSKTILTNKFMYRNQVLIESKNIEPQFILINFESTENSYCLKDVKFLCCNCVEFYDTIYKNLLTYLFEI